jgi:hypothetical protein
MDFLDQFYARPFSMNDGGVETGIRPREDKKCEFRRILNWVCPYSLAASGSWMNLILEKRYARHLLDRGDNRVFRCRDRLRPLL